MEPTGLDGAQPHITEINSIEEVAVLFEYAHPDDLFVFDVDLVILEPVNPAQQMRFHAHPELSKIKAAVGEFIKKKPNPDEFYFSRTMQREPSQPVEQALIDNILAL
jgi:hypothetical protein